ncbi:hypothetical protein J4435_00420 [Candidatus Woesearchaeota archaeon]|nr:hypothetical protein [Candidatus Woesearchaeota archaeon]
MGNKALEVIMIKKAICILTIFVLVYSSAALAQYGNGQYPESSGSSGGPGGSSGPGGYPGSSPYEGYSGGPGMMDGGSGAVAYPYPGDGYGGMQNPGRNSEFSYEREGFDDRMDYGPSYGGYSKEHMVFGMVFQHIGDDINPRSVKDYCDNPEGMADIVIAKLKEKVGDLQSICAKAGAEETKCGEMVKEGCMRMGQFFPPEGREMDDMMRAEMAANACPPNKDALEKACKARIADQLRDHKEKSEERCKWMMEAEGKRMLADCERARQNQDCDKDRFMERCRGVPSQGSSGEGSWNYQQCPQRPSPVCSSNQVLQKKVDSNGCAEYYCEGAACPDRPVPACGSGQALQKKADSNGCVDYYCEGISCPADTYQCPDGTSMRRNPANNCNFDPCPAPRCPEPVEPTCDANSHVAKKDDNGCAYYYCEPNADADGTAITGNVVEGECPRSETPQCGPNSYVQKRVDDKGCVFYYCEASGSGWQAPAAGSSGYGNSAEQCERQWESQKGTCERLEKGCGTDALLKQCLEQNVRGMEQQAAQMEKMCAEELTYRLKHIEERCSRMGEEQQRCLEYGTKRCGEMKGMAEQCRSSLTEENLRKFVIEETRKRCKFSGLIGDREDIGKADKVEILLAVLNSATEEDMEKLGLFVENLQEQLKLEETTVYKGVISPKSFGDIRTFPFVVNAKISAVKSSNRSEEAKQGILSGSRAEEAAGKLASLRDSDVPDEYLYLIEDKASDILNVSDNLKELEGKENEKGFGYKFRLLFGLAKEAEGREITQLEESKKKLEASIEALTTLADEVPSDVAKAVLTEQIGNLKQQLADIEALIEAKQKKASGLFGIFG